jgi:hypothetical protein
MFEDDQDEVDEAGEEMKRSSSRGGKNLNK